MTKRFPDATADDRNEASGQVLPAPQSRSNRNQHVGGASMADNGHYTDSASVDNPEQNGTWRSIGDLARALAEKSGGAK